MTTPADTSLNLEARFRPGDRVHVAARPADGHCRTPWYLRGQRGIVTAVQGPFRDPEQLAYHRPGLPGRMLYKVRFRQRDLWSAYAGDSDDHLEADIYEHWLAAEGRP
jgi:nitrile hydratase